MEDAVAVLLEHAGVGVEARVTEFGNLLRKEFDTVRRVTEDDRLVDLELRGGRTRKLAKVKEAEEETRRTLEKRVLRQ